VKRSREIGLAAMEGGSRRLRGGTTAGVRHRHRQATEVRGVPDDNVNMTRGEAFERVLQGQGEKEVAGQGPASIEDLTGAVTPCARTVAPRRFVANAWGREPGDGEADRLSDAPTAHREARGHIAAGHEPPNSPVVEGLGSWSWMFPPPPVPPPNLWWVTPESKVE